MKLSVFLSCYTDTSDICPLVEQCHLIEYCPVLPPSRSKKTATELTMYFTQSPQNKTAPERRHIGPITTSEHYHPAYLETWKSSSGGAETLPSKHSEKSDSPNGFIDFARPPRPTRIWFPPAQSRRRRKLKNRVRDQCSHDNRACF